MVSLDRPEIDSNGEAARAIFDRSSSARDRAVHDSSFAREVDLTFYQEIIKDIIP